MDYKYIENEVLKAKNNDSIAILNIINCFKPYCLTLIKNTNVKSYDKEDLLQELNIKIVQCIKKYNKENKFVGYCTKALKNHIYNLYNKNKNYDIQLSDKVENKLDLYLDKYNNIEYINLLNDIEKNVILLYYINGNTLREVSSNLKISYSKTVSIRNKALTKLRNEIK